MSWQTGWRTVLPGKHVPATATSEKASVLESYVVIIDPQKLT